VVCVAGNSIETPRLLLLSASSKYLTGWRIAPARLVETT